MTFPKHREGGSNETKSSPFGHYWKHNVWHKPFIPTSHQPENTIPTVRHGGGSSFTRESLNLAKDGPTWLA